MKTKPAISSALIGFIIALAIGAICTSLGWNDFMLYNADEAIKWINQILSEKIIVIIIAGVSLWINFIPFVHIPAKLYSKKSWIFMIALIPAYIALAGLGSSIGSMLLTIVAMLILRKPKRIKDILNAILRFLVICIITIFYEIISGYIKTAMSPTDVYNLDAIYRLIMCLDYYIFLSFVYKYQKRRDLHGESKSFKELYQDICMVFWRRRRIFGRWQNVQKDARVSSLKGFDYWFMVIMQPVQLLLVALAVSINHKLIVFLLVFIAGFLPQKRNRQHTIYYHAGTWYGCLVQTVVSFYVVCSALPLPNITMFVPTLGGVAFWWATTHYAVLKRGKLTVETIDVDGLKQLIAQYPLAPKHEWKREIITLSFVDHMTVEKIAEHCLTSISTVNATRKASKDWIEAHI